jgi:hypothetical protein
MDKSKKMIIQDSPLMANKRIGGLLDNGKSSAGGLLDSSRSAGGLCITENSSKKNNLSVRLSLTFLSLTICDQNLIFLEINDQHL